MNQKKEFFIYFFTFFLVFLIYSSESLNSQSILSLKPLLRFKLDNFLVDIIEIIAISIPYLIAIVLVISMIFYFSNLVKKPSIRKFLKLASLILIVIGLSVLSKELTGGQSPQNLPITFTNESESFSSMPDDTVTVSSTNQNTNSKTITYVPESSQNTNVNNFLDFNQDLVKFLIFFLAILFIFLFIRSSKTNRNIHHPANVDQSFNKSIRKNDSHRKFIIEEYLKISKLLEFNGINPDFSLTPVEFENETIKNLKITEIAKITYYYELARFSDISIESNEIEDFTFTIHEINRKINLLHVENK
jgi:hypothetical protein